MSETIIYKKCKKCNKEKNIDLFRNQRNSKDSKFPWCTDCQDKESKNNYQKNKTRRLELVKNWQKQNPDKIKEYKKKWNNKIKRIYSEILEVSKLNEKPTN